VSAIGAVPGESHRSARPVGGRAEGRGAVPEPEPAVADRPPTRLDSEPDYRFTLANERTFLAWFRTALALIAGGVAVVQLVPEFAFPGARHALGVVLTLTGGALSLAAVARWRRVQAAMRRAEDLPATHVPALLGGGLAAVTLVVVVLFLLSAGRA
jgi:putative membrane protein